MPCQHLALGLELASRFTHAWSVTETSASPPQRYWSWSSYRTPSPSPISSAPTSAQTTPENSPPTSSPTSPETSPPHRTPSAKERPRLPISAPPDNFGGSSKAVDYIFDLDAPPRTHPLDVQGYLYLVGAKNPAYDGSNWDAGMAAGLSRLREARARGQGLFVEPPSDAALMAAPCFPFLHGLSHNKLDSAVETLHCAHFPKDYDGERPGLAWYAGCLVLGNVRVIWPNSFVRADHPLWLDAIVDLYGFDHPALVRVDLHDEARGLWPTDAALLLCRNHRAYYGRRNLVIGPVPEDYVDLEDEHLCASTAI